MVIYKITNKESGKVYIGQTIRNVKKRWIQHCRPNSKKTSAITCAIKKYGKASFNFEVIDTATSIEELNQKEIKYIAELNCIAPNGYNLEVGGKSHIRHPSTGEKISAARKGHSVSEETRKKIADKLKGTHLTEETKAKLSILRKGKKVHTEESKRKIGAASKGRNVGRIRIDKRSLNFLDIRSEY